MQETCNRIPIQQRSWIQHPGNINHSSAQEIEEKKYNFCVIGFTFEHTVCYFLCLCEWQFCMDGKIGRAEGRAHRAKAMDGLSQSNQRNTPREAAPPRRIGVRSLAWKNPLAINSLRSNRIRSFPDFSCTPLPASKGPRLLCWNSWPKNKFSRLITMHISVQDIENIRTWKRWELS